MSQDLTRDEADQILSLTQDPRWLAVASYLQKKMAIMDAMIHSPKTSEGMTQYFRGGYAFGQDMLDLGRTAHERITKG